MTIGEKIRYFRTRIGITEGKLAELSLGHSPCINTQIRNKRNDTSARPQIEKIAESLGVSSFALHRHRKQYQT